LMARTTPDRHFWSSMKTAYIGIGSNMGDRKGHCLVALERMAEIRGCKVTGQSDWYLTEPVGVESQDWYVNGVASLSAEISAEDLLRHLLTIEKDMGRPLMHLRRFVLVPMAQIAPRVVHPILGMTMEALLERFSGSSQDVLPLKE